jgi:RNA polymerase sigma-70 factor, ECF subfamily
MAYAQAPQISPNSTADAELVRRARDRDEAAIRAIMRSNNRRLYRLARGILRNDSEAEDVVQETYVRAFTHLDSFRGGSSFGTWLGRIAINEALGRLRRRRAAVEWTSLEGEVLNAQIIPFPAAAASDPEKTMAQRQIQHVVEQAIDELPEPFRIVFMTRVAKAKDRTRGDGGVPVRRQAMPTPHRGNFEAVGIACVKRDSLESPSRFSLLFAHDLRANVFRVCQLREKPLHTLR